MTEAIKTDCIVIGGDFNLPNFDWNQQGAFSGATRGHAAVMSNFMNLFALTQTVLQPTRGNHVLDLFLTNEPDLLQSTLVIPGISDHDIVVCEMNLGHIKIDNSSTRRIYNYVKANTAEICNALDSYFIVFETLAESCTVSDLWIFFKRKILELQERFVPTWILTTRRNKSKPWFTKQLQRLTQRKQRIYRAFKNNPIDVNLNKLKAISSELKTKIAEAKCAYFESFQGKVKENPKELWKYIKKNKKDNVSVPTLLDSDNIINKPIDKAQCFNSYFSSVFSLPVADNVRTERPVWGGVAPMEDILFDSHGINILLERSSVSKAAGPDGLPNALLKSCARSITPYLKVIFEKSLHDCALPNDWKIASVVPAHKSGARNVISNYRPISLTSVCCKILEHILYTSILKHIDGYSLFNPFQHGFRKGLSCVTQLTEFTHDIAQALDNRATVDCVFIDFRKAFDLVPHTLLVQKLSKFNINPKVISWIAEYLRERRQYVVVSGAASTIADVTSGVPQGSVLGPLLFLLYINDINENVTSCMRMFADDCVLYKKITCESDNQIVQNDLDAIYTWCEKWGMKLNLDKTVSMTFSRKQVKTNFRYVVNNIILQTVSEYKYLGVYFTTSLSWHRHVDFTIAKASRSLGFIKRNTRQFPHDIRELLYKTNVRSILEYACTVWDPPTNTDKEKIEKVQNLAARYVLGKPKRGGDFSATRARQTLKWDTLEHRRAKLRLKLFHSIYHSQSGIPRETYISSPHYVSARVDHAHKVRELRCKTVAYSSSFFPKTISQWNRLPSTIASVIDNDAFYAALETVTSFD